ncbi:MAG: CpsD/CapB family tyrosine-protein kinase [Clostridiales bacterium]|nr:CpsD/CapB family tyrosine-protein kinase [Clostridiales bacterium]
MSIFKREQDIQQNKRTLRVVSANSSFGYTESYKALRTNLNYVLDTGAHERVLMVTSSVPAEGKSNVAVNLAVTLAQDNKKVILLDCDLRKGTLHRYLRIPRNQKGITDVINGQAELEDTIVKFSDIGISVLTAGIVPPNPTELLGSSKMGYLLSHLSSIYDYVICDTPPVNAVTDTSVLSKYTDGAILVVSHDQVSRKNVLAAKKQLESMNVNIFGVVLNMYNVKKTGADSRDYYAYYNCDYYSDDVPSKKESKADRRRK